MRKTTCPRCGLELNEHSLPRHLERSRCKARQLAAQLRKRGLHPVELRYQAKSDHVINTLRLLGLTGHVELHKTRNRKSHDDIAASRRGGVSAGNEVWTSLDGITLALIVEEAARLLAVSYPEAGRRLVEHRELIGAFGVAWKLGEMTEAGEDGLRDILEPIDYILGTDGRRRPNPSIAFRRDLDAVIEELETDGE